MSINSIIQQQANFNLNEYNSLVEQAASKGVDQTTLDKNLILALQSGATFKTATTQVQNNLPVLATPEHQAQTNIALLGGMPSPMGIFAALMTESAAEDRKANREGAKAAGDAAIEKMRDEASEIRSNAKTQLALGIVGGLATMTAGTVQAGVASGMIPTIGNVSADCLSSYSQGVGQAIGGGGQIIGSVGTFLDSTSQAQQKELQADAEKLRNLKEQMRSFNDSLNEFINKVMSAYDAIQQSQNQTRQKILG